MPFRNLTTSCCLFALVLVLSVVPLNAQTPLRTEIVVSGLTRPVFATSPVGDFNRLFVVEQRGSASTSNRADIRIMDINTRTMYTKPFLSISPVRTSSEEGLLGLAFHPNYAGNGYFFTYHTNTSGDNVVTRWQVSGTNPDSANPASASILMTIPHPLESNHNGGWMAFGPDGFLYISAGDGGGSNDEHNNGQNLNTLLGSMLRIDVDSGTPYGIPPSNPFFGGPQREEIYYWGLRNAWRNSFDRLSGDLYIGDVGQGQYEEINFRPAADTGNINFGWPLREGAHCYIPSVNCDPSGITTDPIHEYTHSLGCSITGGYNYTGCAIPDLNGTYFFGDYCEGTVWSFRYDGINKTDFQNRTVELDLTFTAGLTSFAEDNYGELYLLYQDGEIRKIVPDVAITDCNGNDLDDSCEIFFGVVQDANFNGVPDSCDPPSFICGDADGGGTISVSDAVFLIAHIFGGGPAPVPAEAGDANCSGGLSISDAVYVIAYIFGGGPAPCAACP
ncbi:MAG: PQQ-dependent sugar dehydrogenase [bacterium]|nr:PQQ-dependent sugar dehydrogenase [bacterium]